MQGYYGWPKKSATSSISLICICDYRLSTTLKTNTKVPIIMLTESLINVGYVTKFKAQRVFTFILLNIEDKVVMGSMCCCSQVLFGNLKMYVYGLCNHVDYFWLICATYFYVYLNCGFVRRDQALSLLTTEVCVHNLHSTMQAGVHQRRIREVCRLILCICCSGYLHYNIFSSIRSLTADYQVYGQGTMSCETLLQLNH